MNTERMHNSLILDAVSSVITCFSVSTFSENTLLVRFFFYISFDVSWIHVCSGTASGDISEAEI